MKRLTFALTLLLAACSLTTVHAQENGERERKFVRALELSANAKTPADYRKAAELLESVLADGYQNGAVYYNLGNACMNAREYGRAIAAYRKARLYLPRYNFLEANLKQALANAPGRLAQAPAPWWQHVLFWSEWLSYPEKFQAAALGFCLAALLAMAGLIFRSRRFYFAGGAALLLAALVSVDAALAYNDVNYGQHAVVVCETAARKGMGDNYEPAFNQPLKDGAEFTILDRSGDWVLGHFEGVGDGWLRRDAITE